MLTDFDIEAIASRVAKLIIGAATGSGVSPSVRRIVDDTLSQARQEAVDQIVGITLESVRCTATNRIVAAVTKSSVAEAQERAPDPWDEKVSAAIEAMPSDYRDRIRVMDLMSAIGEPPATHPMRRVAAILRWLGYEHSKAKDGNYWVKR
jgi:hypothetical protein